MATGRVYTGSVYWGPAGGWYIHEDQRSPIPRIFAFQRRVVDDRPLQAGQRVQYERYRNRRRLLIATNIRGAD